MNRSENKENHIEFSLLHYKTHITQEDIRAALDGVLENQQFAKSHRMCTLLKFIVEHALTGEKSKLNEYEIGVSVFDRNPLNYSTCDDPIVRVQIGRLRKKLSHYYSVSAPHVTLRFFIPMGSYIPSVRVSPQKKSLPDDHHSLSVQPFKCITLAGAIFAQGLCEELSYRLYESFENPLISHSFTAPHHIEHFGEVAKELSFSKGYTLEGSVRVEPSRVRTSVRLVDTAIGLISWSAQFDRESNYGISIQEDLANTICCALKAYFDERRASPL